MRPVFWKSGVLMCVSVPLALGLVLLAVAGDRGAAVRGPAGLPEGEGIAAKYPGDQDIERDPTVVFADGLEAAEVGRLRDGYHWGRDTKWDNSWGGCLIVEQAENVHSGKKAVEMTIVRPGSGEPGGAGLQKYFEEGFDTLFLRYYAKFEKNTELYHGGAHNGAGITARAPGVPQACPGVRADGANRFDVHLDSWRPQRQIPSPGHLVTYVYHMDQVGRWGDQFFPSGRVNPPGRELFGEHFVPRPDIIPDRDRWYCYELMLQANTPGRRDGRAAFWVDGRLVGDFPNLRFRNVATLKSNHIGLDFYTNNPRVRNDVTIWYDDVVAATSYIGPQAPAK